MSRPPGTLLPVLQEAEWSGRELAVVRPLVDLDTEQMPLVSFAYDDASRRYTVTPSALEEEGRSQEALEWEAMAQLRRRPCDWEVRARRDDGWPEAVSLVDEFAASFVLDRERMQLGHQRLASPQAWLAIPSRGILVLRAAGAKPDEEPDESAGRALEAWAKEAFSKALDTRVSPTVFLAREGEIVGVLAPTTQGSKPLPTRLEPGDYDAAERRMTFLFCPGAEPLEELDLAAAMSIERRARLAPEQPVDEVWVCFPRRADARKYAPLVEASGLVPAVPKAPGESGWEELQDG